MKTIRLLLALPALLIAGCSTAVSPKESAGIDLQKTGLVLATVSWHGPEHTSIEFRLYRVNGRDSAFRNPAIDSTKDMSLVEVPVGRYEIADWTVAGGEGFTGPGTPATPQPFQFEVQPGQITYLGHIEVTAAATNSSDYGVIIRRARPVLEDRCQETVAEFRLQYPALAGVPVHSVAPQRIVLARPTTERYPSFTPAYAQTKSLDPMPTGPKWP